MVDSPTPSAASDTPKSITPAEAATRIEALLGGAAPPDDEEQPPKTPEGDEPPDSPPTDEPGENEPVEEDDDNAAEEGEEAEGEEQPEAMFTVEIDGEEVPVPIEEARAGYLRNSDYTQKTQELAQGRRQLEQAAVALVEERQRYATLLPQLEELIANSLGQEPDWALLAQQPDPSEYWRQKARWDERTRQLDAVTEQKQRVAQLQQLDMVEKLQNHLAQSAQVMLRAIPRWKDDKVATADKAALKTYAKQSGFSDWEIEHAYDHRVLIWGHKARLYDQLMAQGKPKPQQPGKGLRPLAPGAAVNQQVSKVSNVTRAKQRFAKTRRLADGEAAIEAIIQRGL